MNNRFLNKTKSSSFSPMMLHTFGMSGHLPAGIHNCTLESSAAIVCFNPYRRRLWSQLANFLLCPVYSGDFSYAYLGGEYVSAKRNPRDIDLVLETAMPYGTESFEVLSPFFVTGLEQIKKDHGIHLHFWMEDAPSNVFNSKTFYQSPPYANQHAQRLNPHRGIIRWDLKDPRILTGLQAYAKEDQTALMCKF